MKKNLLALFFIPFLFSCGISFDDDRNSNPNQLDDNEEPKIISCPHEWGELEHDTTHHWKKCSKCNEVLKEGHHSNFMHVCGKKMVCDVCGVEFGEIKEHDLELKKEGYITFSSYLATYYQCKDCFGLFVKDGNEYLEVDDFNGVADVSKAQMNNLDDYGTENNPFLIANENDLIALKDLSLTENFSGKYFKLLNDITVTSNFEGNIGPSDAAPFSDIFDGNNHSIKNFSRDTTPLSSGGDAIGFFSRLTNATVKNLTLENVDIKARIQRAAPFAARCDNAVIKNCHASGSISCPKQSGGLVGIAVSNLSISDCSSTCNVNSSDGSAGGIISEFLKPSSPSYSSCNISLVNVSYNGSVIGNTSTGGIIANLGIDVSDVCLNNVTAEGTVTSQTTIAGGLIATGSTTKTISISNCENKSNVSGKTIVGGIFANHSTASSLNIEDTKSSGNVSYDKAMPTSSERANFGLGGFLGIAKKSFKIENSNHSGQVNGTYNCGGFVGCCSGTGNVQEILNCDNKETGIVTGTSEANAGFVANLKVASLKISGCNNFANITGVGNGTGGILGEADATSNEKLVIENCENRGDIIGKPFVGGIVGLARAISKDGSIITGCKNYADISGTSNVGGIGGAIRMTNSNNSTYKQCSITINDVTKKAFELSEKSNSNSEAGYILGYDANNVIPTGSSLLN